MPASKYLNDPTNPSSAPYDRILSLLQEISAEISGLREDMASLRTQVKKFGCPLRSCSAVQEERKESTLMTAQPQSSTLPDKVYLHTRNSSMGTTTRRIQREAAPAQADKSCGFSVESAIIPAHSGENQQKDKEEQPYLLNHWKNCVPPGIDDAA